MVTFLAMNVSVLRCAKDSIHWPVAMYLRLIWLPVISLLKVTSTIGGATTVAHELHVLFIKDSWLVRTTNIAVVAPIAYVCRSIQSMSMVLARVVEPG